MSRHGTGHSDEGRMLGYIDGELSAREARQVERHLEACWQCRSELDELKRTVARCVRYRQSVLDRHLPPPPQPWADLYREFARIDSAAAQAGWLERMARPFPRPMAWRWVASALAAAMVLGAVFLEFRRTPSVHAAELLQKAVAVEQSQPKAGRHIRIRTKTQEITG